MIRPDPQDPIEGILFAPIGVAHSPFRRITGMPIQPSRAMEAQGWVEIFEEYAEGLKDLDGFSHIILIYHFHVVKTSRCTVTPFLDTTERGVFATRAPTRPNPIGLSVVELVGIVGNRLNLRNIDVLDGTPILDIKPYVPDFDAPRNVRTGWLEAALRTQRDTTADDRFEAS